LKLDVCSPVRLAQQLHQNGGGEHNYDLEQSFGGKYSAEGRHCTVHENAAFL
jgi:hypothetical protein